MVPAWSQFAGHTDRPTDVGALQARHFDGPAPHKFAEGRPQPWDRADFGLSDVSLANIQIGFPVHLLVLGF